MKMHDIPLPEGVEQIVDKTSGQLAQSLADAVADHLQQRLMAAPRASLVVSGGSTPVPFFEALREKPLDWPRIDVVLADERWVEEDCPDSNTRLVREHLLSGPAAEVRYLSLKQPGATPEQGLAAVDSELAHLTLPIDVLILGMGNDGHTASLFPDAPELPQGLDMESSARAAVMTPPSQRYPRISLTRKVLSSAAFTALHLRGDDKLATLAEACQQLDDIAAMPIRAFIRPGLKIYWSP